jgi:hypothetical protein
MKSICVNMLPRAQTVVPQHRRLDAGFSSRRPGFAPGAVYVRSVLDKVAYVQALLRVILVSLVSSISSVLHIFTHVASGRSVSIMPGYGLDAGPSRFDPRQRRKDFSCSLCVQTGFEAHPASYCTIGTGGLFPGLKRGQDVTLTTHPI